MAKEKTPAQRGRDKVRPDEGQGSKGNFGDDGDWGAGNNDMEKARQESSPVKIKKPK